MIDRDITPYLLKQAKQFPVVTITGPRQSGKTTLAKMTFPAYKYVSLENLDNRSFAESDPRGFLKLYSNNVIIDEIQRVPTLFSYIQEIVDENNREGEFILTGSQQFGLIEKITQSLAGRTALLRLLPLSIKEISASDKSEVERENLMFKGFYPRIYDKKIDSYDFLSFYINTYIEKDVRQLINVKDISQFIKFISLCAGRSGQILNMNSLGSDCGIATNTVKSWLSILEASYIIFLLKPYYTNTNKRLIKAPKLYFYDVGLMSHLIGIKQKEQIFTHPLRGEIFETMIVSDIFKSLYNLSLRIDLYYYRDSNQNEVDLIVEDGLKIHAIEIKSAVTFSSKFLKTLKYIKNILPEKIEGSVIYGGDDTYEREGFKIYSFRDVVRAVIRRDREWSSG